MAKTEWIDGLLYVNPPAGTVIADSGPLYPGDYIVQFLIVSDSGIQTVLEYRDQGNAVTLKSQILPVVMSILMLTLPCTVNKNERIRLTTRADVQTKIYGLITTTANLLYTIRGPIVVPVSNAVCYLDGGTTPVQQLTVTYAQQ